MTLRLASLNLLLLSLLLCACSGGPTALPSSPTPSPTPLVGPVVPIGEPVTRDLAIRVERVPNCGGGNEPIAKRPSMSSFTTHSVEWEVGGTTGVGAVIGEGVLPGGVNLSAALDGHYITQIDVALQQSEEWDLQAGPGTVEEHTVKWQEVWQPGTIAITLAGRDVFQVNVLYRTAINSEIIEQRAFDCVGNLLTAAPSMPTVVTATPRFASSQPRPLLTPPFTASTEPTLIPPWDVLLSNWQAPQIIELWGDKTVKAVGPFQFKVHSDTGNYCGIVASGVYFDAIQIYNTPLHEYWPVPNQNYLISYLTMADGQKNNSHDMEDFCADSPGYTFVLVTESTPGQLQMSEMVLPIPFQ